MIADLHSDLSGQNHHDAGSDPIRGTLAGLNRNCMASGPAFDALVDRVAEIMRFSSAELWQSHRNLAPWLHDRQVLNFDKQHHSEVNAYGAPQFSAADVQRIVQALPSGQPVCLHGRAPAIAIATIAHKHPVEWLFDVRLGWVQPAALRIAKRFRASSKDAPVTLTVEPAPLPDHPHRCLLHVVIASPPLDIADAAGIPLPALPAHSEVVIDGVIPHWLLAGVAHAYRHCASVTANQPRQPRPAISPCGNTEPSRL